ncbi:unnamed protein product [Pleuronectes platessa]|uniref:Uncharacterized protein n=1 Tax=Pleuronectes platessa TaxID=8262 RepID=A0A9N7UGL7_PLEPL|nr:unnamed protein product [Pleuronectes platessa]
MLSIAVLSIFFWKHLSKQSEGSRRKRRKRRKRRTQERKHRAATDASCEDHETWSSALWVVVILSSWCLLLIDGFKHENSGLLAAGWQSEQMIGSIGSSPRADTCPWRNKPPPVRFPQPAAVSLHHSVASYWFYLQLGAAGGWRTGRVWFEDKENRERGLILGGCYF